MSAQHLAKRGMQMIQAVLRIVTVPLVSVAMALSLAHALEFPGKRRLDEETYRAVQSIYYPGFTLGGLGEFIGVILTGVLLLLTPVGSMDFWLTLVALFALIGDGLVGH